MSEKLKVAVGDTVQIHSVRRDYEAEKLDKWSHKAYWKDVVVERVVTRVGTKLAYIEEYGRERAFYLAGGLERKPYDGPSTMHTEETLVEYFRRRDLVTELNHLTTKYGWQDDYTTDAIAEIVWAMTKPGAKR